MFIKVLVVRQEQFLRNLRGVDDQRDLGAQGKADDWRYLLLAFEVRGFEEFNYGVSLGLILQANKFLDLK